MNEPRNEPGNLQANEPRMTPLVEMRNISRAFGGVQAVDNVTVEVHRGEVLGLLGHNGAGKSTLVQILAGAIQRDTGTILIDGQVVEFNNPKDAKQHGIETIYQTLALADNLDAVDNLFLGREVRQMGIFRNRKLMRDEAAKVLKLINPRFVNYDTNVRSLSGGQRQAIAIARAVYFNAKVLILDEPTAALGPSETELFKDLVGRLKAQGVGIVLISHDIHDVFDLADRLVVMTNGRVVGRLNTHEATKDQVLGMIILGGADDALSPEAQALVSGSLQEKEQALDNQNPSTR